MKPGCLSLNVRTLIAELHEGLFLSQLLLPPSPSRSVHDASGEQVQGGSCRMLKYYRLLTNLSFDVGLIRSELVARTMVIVWVFALF